MVLTLSLIASTAGCASGGYVQDASPPAPHLWCADEARAVASQPLSVDASREQQQAVRDYHMSKACQQAYDQSAEIRLPVGKPPS
ncbi:hypothetical protein [Pseudoxanthomonas sp. UTMC 1351]|uniref:hypothetical protein n=1 Tax=Pseudoxanthomonas sp. UTMC 1351 TaxID=2695853 RepID=UPI0034CE83FF